MPRPRNPKPIKLVDRDFEVLSMLYDYDGLMARRQIARLCFPGRDESRVKHRLRDLYDNGYVNQPDENTKHRVDEWVYWLDVKGYHLVAQRAGREATKAELSRAKGFAWDRIPHHLRINDVRIALVEALAKQEGLLHLDRWKTQWELNRRRTDRFEYRLSGGKVVQGTYVADGFCLIRQPTPHRAKDRGYAYLLEVDTGTESQTVISQEKLRRGYEYIRSKVFVEQFGIKFGRMLMVTTGDERMHNIRRNAYTEGVSAAFFFSTFERLGFARERLVWQLGSQLPNVLTDPVWFRADAEEPVALIELLA